MEGDGGVMEGMMKSGVMRGGDEGVLVGGPPLPARPRGGAGGAPRRPRGRGRAI